MTTPLAVSLATNLWAGVGHAALTGVALVVLGALVGLVRALIRAREERHLPRDPVGKWWELQGELRHLSKEPGNEHRRRELHQMIAHLEGELGGQQTAALQREQMDLVRMGEWGDG